MGTGVVRNIFFFLFSSSFLLPYFFLRFLPYSSSGGNCAIGDGMSTRRYLPVPFFFFFFFFPFLPPSFQLFFPLTFIATTVLGVEGSTEALITYTPPSPLFFSTFLFFLLFFFFFFLSLIIHPAPTRRGRLVSVIVASPFPFFFFFFLSSSSFVVLFFFFRAAPYEGDVRR